VVSWCPYFRGKQLYHKFFWEDEKGNISAVDPSGEGYFESPITPLRMRYKLEVGGRKTPPLRGKKPHWGLVSLGASACIFKVSNPEADKPWRSTYILVFSSWK